MKHFFPLCFALFLSIQVFGQDDHPLDILEVMNDRSLSLAEVEAFAAHYFQRTEKTDGMYKRYQRWLAERKFHSDDQGKFIVPSVDEAKFNAFRSANPQRAITVGTWTNDGPFTWNATSGWNPGNGRLTAMASHPSRPNTILVGSPDGGIWKTTNGGSSWQPLTDANASRMQIRALASAPSDRNVFYAGTENGVVLRSGDAGASWTEVSSGPTGEIRKILVNPNRSDMIHVAARNGMWKSYNNGDSWFHRLDTGNSQMDDIEYKPGTTRTMYASGQRLFKSTDFGNTWIEINSDVNIPIGRRTLISVTPNRASVLYVVQSKSDQRSFEALYLSTNSGDTFSKRYERTSNNNNLFGFFQNDNRGQAWLHMAMTVSPSDWREVHVAGLVTFRSRNSGSSFTQTSEWLGHDNATGYTHSDITGMEFVGSTLYVTSDGGLYNSTNAGDDWTDLSNGLSIRTVYRMGSSLTDSNLYVAGCQDTGSFVHDSSGFKDWLGADGMEGLVHPTNNNWIFGTSQNGQTYWSGDRGSGQRVNLANLDGPWITPWAIGSTVDSGTGYAIMYAGTNNGIYKSTNGGGSYFKISPNSGTTALPGRTEDLTIDHNNSNYIYASVGSSIFHSHNGGTNWYRYNGTVTGATALITDIKVHPTNAALIYFTTANNSNNGGRIFSYNVVTGAQRDLSGNLPKFAFRSLVIDHDAPYRIYAAGNVGIYASDNDGATWTEISSNLPKVPIREIDLQRSSHKLRVATYGRGIWEYSRQANRNPVEETEIVTELPKVKKARLYPNPADAVITLNLNGLEQPTSAIITSAAGVIRLRHDNINRQSDTLNINVSSLNPGVYVLQLLNTQGVIEQLQFIKR